MQRLFLIGPMGAGKTTLGKLIARELDYQFIDSDRVIEDRTGVSIPTIFDIEGEAGFRARESRIINELTQLDNIVLATGGGAILRRENREWLMKENIYAMEEISRRLLEAASRKLWHAEQKLLNDIQEIALIIEGEMEENMGEVNEEFQGGKIEVLTPDSVEEWQHDWKISQSTSEKHGEHF